MDDGVVDAEFSVIDTEVEDESVDDSLLFKHVNWLAFVKQNKLTDKQILKYKDYINNYSSGGYFYSKWWAIITYQTQVSESILEEYWQEMISDNNIRLLLHKKKLSMNFIYNHFADIKNCGISLYFFKREFYSDDERKEIRNLFELYGLLV